MPQKPQPQLLTKDEIKALIDSGDLNPDVAMSKLLPPEQAIYQQFVKQDLPQEQVPFKDAGRPAGPANAAGLIPFGLSVAAGATGAGLASPAIRAAASGFGASHPYLTGGAGMIALDQARKLGIPSPVINALETALGFKTMMSGGVGKAAAGAAEAAEAGAASKIPGEVINPMTAEEFAAASGGRARATYDPRAFGVKPPDTRPFPPNVDVRRPGPRMPDPEIAERVQGGVQNDFRGPVTFRKPFPPNVSTQETTADLEDRILGTSRTGQTPLQYHESAPPDMRKSVDGLKRKTARRKPD